MTAQAERRQRTMRVTVTGTGTPTPRPDRAGAGVVVEVAGVALQFDAGRGTSMRLAAVGVGPADLDAVFVTHHHSDHVLGLADLAISRWVVPHARRGDPLTVVAPEGPSATFAREMLAPYAADLEVRRSHTARESAAAVDVQAFTASHEPTVVWRSGEVRVTSVLVEHGPVTPSVAYRVDSGGQSVVVSGDCTVCDAVESLSKGSDLVVHEAMRGDIVATGPYAPIGSYHSDCLDLGAMAERVGIPHLVLTHLIPQPTDAQEAAAFAERVREGGYTGRITVAEDLTSFSLGAAS